MFTLKRLTLNCCLKPCNGFVLLSLKFMIGQIWTSFNSNNNGLKHIPFYFLLKNKKNTDIIPPKVQNKSKIESASAPKNTADKHRKKEGRKQRMEPVSCRTFRLHFPTFRGSISCWLSPARFCSPAPQCCFPSMTFNELLVWRSTCCWCCWCRSYGSEINRAIHLEWSLAAASLGASRYTRVGAFFQFRHFFLWVNSVRSCVFAFARMLFATWKMNSSVAPKDDRWLAGVFSHCLSNKRGPTCRRYNL